MAKKTKGVEVDSDGSERMLIELVERFSVKRAVEWLRIKFPSFDTSRGEELACDATKNENDYFAAAELLGYVTKLSASKSDDTNKPILVAAVKMRKDLTERTSRLVQFNYAKKLLQNAIAKGAQGVSGLPSQGLFFFYDKDGFFRLSLVTGEVEKRRFKYNEAKRQSFYIEPLAANNIVKRRLTPPIKTFAELKEVFSVEQLTKEFYTKLFDWYTWAMSPKVNVSFPNDLDDDTDDRKYNNEAIIRMITRLMFTWFIRQRKLVPDVLFDREGLKDVLKSFEADSMEQDNYYRAILQNLFFATFNCPQTGKGKLARRWIDADVNGAGNGVGLSNDYRVTTVYRYKNEFKKPDDFLELMKKVPFLNCALFDCLDKVQREVDGGKKLYFDGFSTKKKRQAFVPNGLFFDDERGIINLFNLYEFTVNENNADDSDVALDPELLGKVFENLLGAFNPETQETARNATGSFYTPREIVDYMVEESLRNYIKTKVPIADDARLDDLFDRNKAAEGADTMFTSKEREAILTALYSCKILDPACGSGAFPMGILHCMVRLLTRLDPQCVSIREHLLARYRKDKADEDPSETADERMERLEELESRLKEGQHYPDYERKLYLIENCIYGVDIQPIATQISKLRFFISLLCDQLRSSYDPDAQNFGLLSLPNLEAKFVCANTLISLPDLESELKIGDVKELRDELQANRHKIFRARSTKTKEKYKRRDLEIRDAIRETVKDSLSKPDEDVIAKYREQISDAKKRREKVAEPNWGATKTIIRGDWFDEQRSDNVQVVREDLNKKERDECDRLIEWAEKKIKEELSKGEKTNVSAASDYAKLVAGWDPYDQNASSDFFDPEWMFNNATGFDVVIGNPPYVQLQGKLAEQYAHEGFEAYEKTGDIYCLFYEQGQRLLSEGGNVCLITSNKWMRVNYGRSLRNFFLKKCQPILLLDFAAEQIFDAATVDTNILQFVKRSVGSCKAFYACAATAQCRESVSAYVRQHAFLIDFNGDGPWAIVSPAIRNVKAHIESSGTPLGALNVSINYGIKTGLNRVFIVDDSVRNRLIKEDGSARKILSPILYGRDIKRYQHQAHSWLIGTHNGQRDIGLKRINVSQYPSIKKYLDGYKTAIAARSDQGDTPYNLRDCAYWDSFSHTKIVWAELARSGNAFSLDETGCYVETSGFTLTVPDDDIRHLKFLLALLNSKLMLFYLDLICSKLDATGWRWKRQFVEQLPIANYDDQSPLIEMVDEVLSKKRLLPDTDTSLLENKIDAYVYGLYGLTEDEVAIVEGKSKGVDFAVRQAKRNPLKTVAATQIRDEQIEEELE